MLGARIGRRKGNTGRRPRLGPGARGIGSVIAVAVIVAGALASPAFAVSGWTGPTQIGSVGDCADVSAAIDGNGAIHVVAACGTNVRHLTDASGSWVMTTFSHPDDRVDLGPRIAIDGNVIHVAYTRIVPEDDGARSIGVYHRQRESDRNDLVDGRTDRRTRATTWGHSRSSGTCCTPRSPTGWRRC